VIGSQAPKGDSQIYIFQQDKVQHILLPTKRRVRQLWAMLCFCSPNLLWYASDNAHIAGIPDGGWVPDPLPEQ
jgi:hypothetical protein